MASAKREETRECNSCGGKIPISRSQCPHCKSFDIDDAINSDEKDGIVRFSDCAAAEYPNRIQTGAWDVNFGTHYDDDGKAFSGIADTTVTLLGGKNGSGKSTLAMHLALQFIENSNVESNAPCTLARPGHEKCWRRDFLYISAEEGNNALRSRAKRLGCTQVQSDHLLLAPLGTKIKLDRVIEKYKPRGMVGDSISKMVPDIEKAVEFCDDLRAFCEQYKMPAILINHINKDGDQAGLESLQHSVDAVLLFTIDKDKIRIIETIKNRNGEDGVITLYKMTKSGLEYYEEDEDGEDEEGDDDDDGDEYEDE